jgi:hypothetical protein
MRDVLYRLLQARSRKFPAQFFHHMATPPADKIAENVTAASSPASCEKSATADADALTDAGVMPWCCQVDRTLGVGAFGVVWLVQSL